MTVALEASRLTVRFGHFTAVDNVDLSIASGSRHALIGPNGAGKTSLVHALTGNVPIAGGTVRLAGETISNLGQAQRVHKGLVRTFQITQLFQSLTVLDNVCLAIFERERKTLNFWRNAGQDKAVIEEAHGHLQFVDLDGLAKRTVRSLPYGQQRLVEIAVALAARPRVLILDEPAAGVPAAQSEAIFERIQSMPKSLTLLFVEHDMGLVFRFAERISVLVNGRLLAEGTPEAISNDPRVRQVYLGRRGAHASA